MASQTPANARRKLHLGEAAVKGSQNGHRPRGPRVAQSEQVSAADPAPSRVTQTPAAGLPATGSKQRRRPPESNPALSSGHPSTRERESPRGLPPVGREQPWGLPSDPEIRLQDRERGGRAGNRRNPHHDGTFRDMGGRRPAGPTRKPKRPRVSARASVTPRSGLEPETCRLTAGRSTIELSGIGLSRRKPIDHTRSVKPGFGSRVPGGFGSRVSGRFRHGFGGSRGCRQAGAGSAGLPWGS